MARIVLALPGAVPGVRAGPGGSPVPFEAGPGEPPLAAVASPPAVVSAAEAGGQAAEPTYIGLAYAAIAAGAVLGTVAFAVLEPKEFRAAAGFDAFALLYVVTQSLERLFEPVSSWVRGTAGGATQTKPQAVRARDDALALARSEPASAVTAVAAAAGAQARVDQVRRNASVLIWGLQSGIGMVLSGALGIFLLRGIGAAGVPVWIDMVVTGLAIGGGSKALHELIKSVQTAKEQRQDPAEAGGSA